MSVAGPPPCPDEPLAGSFSAPPHSGPEAGTPKFKPASELLREGVAQRALRPSSGECGAMIIPARRGVEPGATNADRMRGPARKHRTAPLRPYARATTPAQLEDDGGLGEPAGEPASLACNECSRNCPSRRFSLTVRMATSASSEAIFFIPQSMWSSPAAARYQFGGGWGTLLESTCERALV